MSERLITLEAKVRWLGEPGPGELAGGRVFCRVCLGLRWLWVAFPRLGQPPREGGGVGWGEI